jgi:Mitochondrial distribution and morphology protein 10
VSEQFTAAATLSALPILDGSIAYAYTSKPLKGVQGTASSALVDLVQGFREVKPPRAPDEAKHWEIWHAGRRVDFRGSRALCKFSNCRHVVLRKDVFPHVKIRGNAHPSSISCLAIYLLFRFRSESWSRKCCLLSLILD